MKADDPVRTIMTEAVLAIEVTESLQEVFRLFASYPMHHLPVVEGRRVVGMLSSADMMKLEFFMPRNRATMPDTLNQRLRIDKVMRTPVVTTTPTHRIEEAAKQMVVHGVHALPVVSPEGNLLGIVTTTDIMQALLLATPRRDATDPAGQIARVPAADELQAAVGAATRAVTENQDPHGMGKALLHLHRYTKKLDEVRNAAQRYVRAGQDERLHAVLVKALEQVEI